MNYIDATYLLTADKPFNIEKKAEEIAVNSLVGNFETYPLYLKEKLEKYKGRIVDFYDFKDSDSKKFKAVIKVGYPVILFNHDIPSILTIIFGKLSLERNIKLIDLDFHPAFLDHFQGPGYGIDGVRNLLGIHHEPLLMSTFQTCFGLNTEEFAEEFYKQAVGGVDFVKDDEAFFDDSLAPFEKRIESCVKKSEEAEKITGRKTLYVANLTGHVDEMIEKAKRGTEAGCKAFLINVLPYGFDILQRLSEEVDAVFVAYPSFSGAVFQSETIGIEASILLGKLMRIAGADLVLFPSPYGNLSLTHHKIMEITESLKENLENIKPSFPVPSEGINPSLVPKIFKDFGTNVVINAGHSVHLHPMGSTAGAKAFRDIIDCTVSGVLVEECAAASEELKVALEKWKNK